MKAYRSTAVTLAAFAALALSPVAFAEHERSDRYEQYPSQQVRQYPSQQVQSNRYTSDRYSDQRQSGNRGDSDLHDQVHEALEDELGSDAQRITVKVRDGHVYLSGWVRDARTRSTAHDIAHDIPGVHGVYATRLYVRRH
ncbi:MAG: BON domain-containing protein [Dokdonella sp.]